VQSAGDNQTEDGQVAGWKIFGVNVAAEREQHVVQQTGEREMREHLRLPPENRYYGR
jgi:hypothetical protein